MYLPKIPYRHQKKVKTPFIRFNEYLIYLMHVNKNKVLFSGTHCQLRRCKCLFTYTGLFHGTLFLLDCMQTKCLQPQEIVVDIFLVLFINLILFLDLETLFMINCSQLAISTMLPLHRFLYILNKHFKKFRQKLRDNSFSLPGGRRPHTDMKNLGGKPKIWH